MNDLQVLTVMWYSIMAIMYASAKMRGYKY